MEEMGELYGRKHENLKNSQQRSVKTHKYLIVVTLELCYNKTI